MGLEEVVDRLVESVNRDGGILRCDTCGRWEPVGDARVRLSTGWPRCHGHTMCWWTQSQLDAGDMPVLDLRKETR